jgi:signal transduction histidine kinase
MPSTPKEARSERSATDQSLGDERRKTDQELARRRTRVEEQADEVLADARERADDVLFRARISADEKMAAVGSPERAIMAEERLVEDAALQGERTVADQNLSRERDARRRALAALLALEREQTDHHLLFERGCADDAIGSRDDVLAMVSHDLRNLLGALALSAASLQSIECEDGVRQQILRGAQRVQRYTARMNRLVGDLLDVVSLDAGRLALVPQRQEAADLLRDTVEAFQPLAVTKDISIRTELRVGSLLAQYDHERILQVLANLVGNAIKFTQQGGRIDILIEPIDQDVRFAVIDTGPGIASDKQGLIFERFWQSAKHPSSGVGLGLYISKCIVEAHGGKLWVESRVNEGSTFYFTLPAHRGTDSPPPPSPALG